MSGRQYSERVDVQFGRRGGRVQTKPDAADGRTA
jgi:hypothetical protein